MLLNLLFTMSLAGSIVFILYILILPLSEKYFSLKWKYRILKIAAAFYLLPVPSLKYHIADIIYFLIPWLHRKPLYIPGIKKLTYVVIVGRDSVEISPSVKYTLLFILFIGIISFVIIQKHIIQYRKWKKICQMDSKKPSECEYGIFMKIKSETGIKKDVQFICSEHCKSPMASGIFSSTIIFPIWQDKTETDAYEYEYMLRHELVHIKHHDLLIKYVGLLVMALHWYNPLVYIMFHEISVISEMYCDNTVVNGKNEQERRKYSNLILKFATQNEYAGKGKFFAGIAGSRNKNVYKRRILEMKRPKKHKTILSVIIMVFICMAGGATTFAYTPPDVVFNSIPGDDSYGKDDGYGEAEFYISEPGVIEEAEGLTKLPSDYFFTDDSGNVYDISNSDISSRKACVHDFSIHGTYNEHRKDGKGGCVTKIYEAVRCSKCSVVKTLKLKYTTTCSPCPH